MIRDELLLEPVVARLCESPAIRALAETSTDFLSDLEGPQYRDLLRAVVLQVAGDVNDAYLQIARAADNVVDDKHPALMAALDAAYLQARARGVTYTCTAVRCARAGASVTTTEQRIAERWMDAHVEECAHSGDYPVAFHIDYPTKPGAPGMTYRDAVLVDEASTWSLTGPLVQDAAVTS